ncbi:MAG: UDP-N-acetylglucosamine--N-acetylmuramyl-(pentapeptide) pyrophosphoryl-undecaprenol N-acetylglucosamine transferase [bacterium]|nr:UDP-N-acetylglucosamine--N-acetylmuramyl-(pentapeptide) pyrophosphoryl-undecaprenol N-acetylglucosamine transferase [bacterium]
MRIILTGGGTGGHVYPAISIKEIIQKKYPDSEFLYIGIKDKAEEHIIDSLPENGKIPIKFITASGLPRLLSPIKLLKFKMDLIRGTFISLKIIRNFSPDLIIASGGYVTAPVLLAGAILRKKQLIHEQNSIPGLVNKFLGRFVDKIFITFPDTSAWFKKGKTVLTGYPTRKAIEIKDKAEARKKLNIPGDAKVVFVFGGSSGAKNINESIARNLEVLLSSENLYLIHGTGKDKKDGYQAYSETNTLLEELYPAYPSEARYICRDYFYDIEMIYSAADLIVCRAGAGTIMECSSIGKPMILVPKSGLPGNHQEKNAEFIEKSNGAVVVYEEKINDHTTLNDSRFAQTILETITNDKLLDEISINAKTIFKKDTSKIIMDEVENLLKL